MAIQGLAYLKTSWNFEERPVASAKLNTWDDRIEAALELAYALIAGQWGGGDGVIRGENADDLKAIATASPGLAVEVQSGWAFIDGFPFKLAGATETVDVAAPDAEDRIDLVQAELLTWNVTIKTGVESASPSAPAADSGCLALAELYLRPGMTSIKNADDDSNGYIIDARAFA